MYQLFSFLENIVPEVLDILVLAIGLLGEFHLVWGHPNYGVIGFNILKDYSVWSPNGIQRQMRTLHVIVLLCIDVVYCSVLSDVVRSDSSLDRSPVVFERMSIKNRRIFLDILLKRIDTIHPNRLEFRKFCRYRQKYMIHGEIKK
ncbi:hypothetical protein IEQ34_015242 [Dendrobium chrysotoxum]|uniref:Uncharacterized protein n=1 Tax=Dendrobium chrysotoxum TaxID=161865 RepID=A0AAV7GHG6_DENCH|nr:hypothetical protein IEQ34_015242 [Dendrobium chrysotoxum]